MRAATTTTTTATRRKYEERAEERQACVDSSSRLVLDVQRLEGELKGAAAALANKQEEAKKYDALLAGALAALQGLQWVSLASCMGKCDPSGLSVPAEKWIMELEGCVCVWGGGGAERRKGGR